MIVSCQKSYKQEIRAATDEKYFTTYAPSEDSDQTAHPRSLIRIFPGRILDNKDAKLLHTDEDSDQTARMRRLI